MLTSAVRGHKRASEGRLMALSLGFIAAFAAIVVGFWVHQVVGHETYERMALNNLSRALALPAPRGVLFDRNGHVLVENRYAYAVAIQRELTPDVAQSIKRLAEITGGDEAEMVASWQRRRREPLFRPLVVIDSASFAQIAAIRARQLELPEVLVQHLPTRNYPADGLAAHLFGYVGEITEEQLSSKEFAQQGLQPGAIIGKAGLERTYNVRLMGIDGSRNVVVDSRGRELDEVGIREPVDGTRMQLTIDLDLQRALESGFKALGFAGGAAILAPSSGEVLAMTSLPAYDPNAFAGGIEGSEWNRLLKDPLKPMTNRLIQGRYSPGSTFKIAMAVAGLEAGVITPETTFFCPGHGTFYGRAFKCNRASGHGTVDLARALEVSCNVYFYNVGDRLTIDKINEYSGKLGLVGKTGIDLPNEEDSLVPSTEWKRRTQKQPWYPGETISVSIGQGAVSVTPLALATMIATVANCGTLVTPHVARAFDKGDGKGWQMVEPPKPKSTVAIAPAHLNAIKEGLWRVVNANGTGARARLEGRDVSGKTGTAQVVGLQNKSAAAATMDVRDHGWFVFYAPRENPQIAGVIFAEHGLHGSSASPIAKHVIDTFFAKQEGRALPVWPAGAPAPLPSVPFEPEIAVPETPAQTVQAPAGRAPVPVRSGGDD